MKTLYFILLLTFCGLNVQAQYYNNDPSYQWWLNLGAGISNFNSGEEQVFLYGSFNKPRTDRLLLSARYSYARELEVQEMTTAERNWDLSALASLYLKGDGGYFSAGTGLGVNGGMFRQGRMEKYLTVGIPIETQLFLTLPNVGLGIVGMANINVKNTNWGVGLAVQFGQLR